MGVRITKIPRSAITTQEPPGDSGSGLPESSGRTFLVSCNTEQGSSLWGPCDLLPTGLSLRSGAGSLQVLGPQGRD
jgi:hypothetical protein